MQLAFGFFLILFSSGFSEVFGQITQSEARIEKPVNLQISPEGSLFVSSGEGYIYRVKSALGKVVFQEIVDLRKGRPLGFDFDPGNSKVIYVADCKRGLVKVRNGKVEWIKNKIGDIKFGFLNDLVVTADGRIFMTESDSSKNCENIVLPSLKTKNGRVLEINLNLMKARVLKSHLHFPNGISITQKEDILYFSESNGGKVFQLDLNRAHEAPVQIFKKKGIVDGLFLKDKKLWITVFNTSESDFGSASVWTWSDLVGAKKISFQNNLNGCSSAVVWNNKLVVSLYLENKILFGDSL